MKKLENKVVELFKESKPDKKKRRTSQKADSKISVIADGNGNIQLGHIEGDVSINKKVTTRTNRLPAPDEITSDQAKFIQEKIHQLAERDVIKGMELKIAYSKWWMKLRNTFKVNSYLALKQSQFDVVVKWLDKQVGMTRAKLRKTDNTTWRNEYYTALNTKAKELNQPKQWLYDQAESITGQNISSLKELNDRDLKKLYQKIFSRYKGRGYSM